MPRILVARRNGVAQDVILHTMTVREALEFAAALKLPSSMTGTSVCACMRTVGGHPGARCSCRQLRP